MKTCMMMDTSTIHTNYDLYGIYTTYETETITEFDHPIGEQIPYCEYWETVRKISNGYEPTPILGHQQWPLQDFMGQPGIFANIESSERVDECDWWQWNS